MDLAWLKDLRLFEGLTRNMDSSKLTPELLTDLKEKFDEVSFKMYNLIYKPTMPRPGSVLESYVLYVISQLFVV